MNVVAIGGRLTRKPDITMVGAKKMPLCKFTVAINEWSKSKGNDTQYVSCIAWGKTGENIAKWFDKGQMIYLNGKLTVDSYENKEGKKVFRTHVVVMNFEFGETKATAQRITGKSVDLPQLEETDMSSGVTADDFMQVPDTGLEELPFT